jgi:hypothetical protein
MTTFSSCQEPRPPSLIQDHRGGDADLPGHTCRLIQLNKDETFFPALLKCGWIMFTDASPSWVISAITSLWMMGDMILLPNNIKVVIVNAAMDKNFYSLTSN